MTLDDGSVCKVLEKGDEQVIRGHRDFWYKIEHQGSHGWVFGSQSNIKQKASINNLEPFLDYFLSTCFYGKNMDSLIYKNSAVTKRFIHPEIGLTRLYNPGAACIPIDYNFFSNAGGAFYGKRNPDIEEITFYKNQEPEGGFCETSRSEDGVYYIKTDALPRYPDMSKDYEIKEIEVPEKYKNGDLAFIRILHKGWIIKTLYFIVADGKWWLVVINDCDCSA